MNKYTIAILILLLTTYISNAQYTWTTGEVILKNGAIVSGEVKIPIVSKDLIHFNGKSKVRVRNKSNRTKSVFNEDQVDHIKFIYGKNEFAYYKYIPVSEKKKEIFCVVTTGSVTLYGRAVGITSTNIGTISYYNLNEFYAQREDEKLATPLYTVRPSKSFKNRAIEYFKDCPNVVSKLKAKSLNKEDIIAVVEKYNNCIN